MGAARRRGSADTLGMTIDLTGPVPHIVPACDHCSQAVELYRLIGTSVALCASCFARTHG